MVVRLPVRGKAPRVAVRGPFPERTSLIMVANADRDGPRRSPPSSRTWPASSRSAHCWNASSSARRNCWAATRAPICLVDEAAGVYRKEADIGIACQSGKVFPLSEGTTGALVVPPRTGDLRELRRRPRRARPPRGPGGAQGRDRRPDLVARRDRRLPAWCSRAIRAARSSTRTPSCWSCSRSTRRSRSRTHGCTRRRSRTPGPRPPRRSATGWHARSTTRSRRGWSRCCCSSAPPRARSPTDIPTKRPRRSPKLGRRPRPSSRRRGAACSGWRPRRSKGARSRKRWSWSSRGRTAPA